MNTYENTIHEHITQLNHRDREVRLSAAGSVSDFMESGELARTVTEEVNNHVHTVYSFSPYSPTMAAYKAWEAGLQTVGIMDHDSVAGCEEMLEAGKFFDIAATVGFEMRVNFSETRMEGRRLNNPDSENLAYMAVHGIPRQRLNDAREFLQPVQAARNQRNRAMVDALNRLLPQWGIDQVDYEQDVYEESTARERGSITERHLMWALSKKVVQHTGKGPQLVSFVQEVMGISIPGRVVEYLRDKENSHYLYDLLGIFKSTLLEEIYLQPDYEECISVWEAVDFARQIGAIPAYAYLGDVTESPTGDKKAQKFEDDYLDELMPELKRIGFQAVTYMPPRNTREQLLRLQKLCQKHNLMEISGVDINSSRQSFNCPEILEPEFHHLVENTWTLIAHEKLASHDETFGFFQKKNPFSRFPLEKRIEIYTEVGKQIDYSDPESIWQQVEPIIKEYA